MLNYTSIEDCAEHITKAKTFLGRNVESPADTTVMKVALIQLQAEKEINEVKAESRIALAEKEKEIKEVKAESRIALAEKEMAAAEYKLQVKNRDYLRLKGNLGLRNLLEEYEAEEVFETQKDNLRKGKKNPTRAELWTAVLMNDGASKRFKNLLLAVRDLPEGEKAIEVEKIANSIVDIWKETSKARHLTLDDVELSICKNILYSKQVICVPIHLRTLDKTSPVINEQVTTATNLCEDFPVMYKVFGSYTVDAKEIEEVENSNPVDMSGC